MAKGFFILFGAPGTGKSTAAAETFPDSFYLSSSPNVLQFYKVQAKKYGLPLPVKEVVLDVYSNDGKMTPGPDGSPVRVPQKAWLEEYLKMLKLRISHDLKNGGALKYKNIVIDECGTFWNRVFAEIEPLSLTKDGTKVDGFASFKNMGKWSNDFVTELRQFNTYGLNVCLICHDAEPEKEKDKKGGPKMPSQTIARQLAADADGVLLRAMEDPPIDLDKPTEKKRARRVWVAHGSQHWLSKLRGLPDDEFEAVKELKLKEILERAGFEP